MKKGEYTFAIYKVNKIDSALAPIADSCMAIVSVKNISVPQNTISVYPNPTQNSFTFSGMMDNNAVLEIFNLLGERIYFENISKGFINKTIDTKNFNAGIVIIKISNSSEQVLLHKEVIIR